MKLLLIFSIFLTGCSYNWSRVKYGDKVRITSGFYKNRIGFATDYYTWITFCQYKVVIRFIDDNSYNFISSCDLEVIND